MYKLKSNERETTIRWDMEDRMATIDTADATMIRKLDKLTADCPETYQCVREDEIYQAKCYQVPARYIRFGKPASAAKREAGRKAYQSRAETIATGDVWKGADQPEYETLHVEEASAKHTYSLGKEG